MIPNSLEVSAERDIEEAIAHAEVVLTSINTDDTASSRDGNNDPARQCHSTIPPECFYPKACVSKPQFRHPFHDAPPPATLPDPEAQPRPFQPRVTTTSIPGICQSSNSESSEQHHSPAFGTTLIQASMPKGLPADNVSNSNTHEQASDEMEPNSFLAQSPQQTPCDHFETPRSEQPLSQNFPPQQLFHDSAGLHNETARNPVHSSPSKDHDNASKSLESGQSHQHSDWTAPESNDNKNDQPTHDPLSRASNSPSPIQRAPDTTMAGALPQGYSHTPSVSTPPASSDADIIFSDDGEDVTSVSTSIDDPSADDARAIRERLGCVNDDFSITGSPVDHVPTPTRRKRTLDRRYHTEPLASPPKLDDVVRRSLIRMRKPLATLLNDVNPKQAAVQVPRVAIESQKAAPQAVTSVSRKKKKMTAAQRYRLHPERETKVPFEQRASDAELIQIGRLADAYTRHYLAPYAFLYVRGRLHQDYVRLADQRDENGQPVFSDTVTRRLFGETTANRRIEAQRIAMQRQGNIVA